MAQTPNPPAYVLFYCETPAESGGATPIVLSDAAAAFLMEEWPDFAKDLMREGVRYHRAMPENTDASSALGRSWKSTFNVSNREDAEIFLQSSAGYDKWFLDPATGDLRTTTCVHHAFAVDPRTGRTVFFNQVLAAYTGWADSRNKPAEAVTLGDGTPLDAKAMAALETFVKGAAVLFPWEAGDVLLIDNRVTMHSRQPFVNAPAPKPGRRILASLMGRRRGRAESSNGAQPFLEPVKVADEVTDKIADEFVLAAAAAEKCGPVNLPALPELPAPPGRSFRAAAPDPVLPSLVLRSGDAMPAVGLGTWKVRHRVWGGVVSI